MTKTKKRFETDDDLIEGLVHLLNDIYEQSEEEYPMRDPSCPACTSDSTPSERNRGLCAYHAGRVYLISIKRA